MSETYESLMFEEKPWETQRGVKLWSRSWKPMETVDGQRKPKEPVGIVIFFHGLHAHSSPVTRPGIALVVNKLVKEGGFYVFSYDHYGHGQSDGLKGLIENAQLLRGDCVDFVKKVKADYPGVPFIIMGESMGGLLALLTGVALQDEKFPDFKGEMLIAPAVCAKIKPPVPVIVILKQLAKLGPSWAAGPGLEPADLWTEQKDRELALKDQYRYTGRIRLQTGQALLDLEATMLPHLKDIEFSFITLHGDKDGTIPLLASEMLFKNAKTPNDQKQMKVYKDSNHDLLHDPATELVIQQLYDWALVAIKK